MPEPKPKEEEQYGPPLPPKATRQWHVPSTTETIARDVGLGGAYDAVRKGEVEVPQWLKVLDPLQMVRDATGWELPTSEDTQGRSSHEAYLRREMRELDKKEGRWAGLPPGFETLPGDMLSMLRLSPIAPNEYIKPGTDPLQDIANIYNRTRQTEPPRQGRTVEQPPQAEAAPEPDYIDWNGSVGVTR